MPRADLGSHATAADSYGQQRGPVRFLRFHILARKWRRGWRLLIVANVRQIRIERWTPDVRCWTVARLFLSVVLGPPSPIAATDDFPLDDLNQ
jgi:hypothetical protein